MAGIPGLEVNDIDMEQWRRAGGTRIPVGEATERTMDDFRRAQQGARPNPNIGTDGLSGEGRAYANRGVGPHPQAPGVSQLPKGPSGPVPGAPAGVRAAAAAGQTAAKRGLAALSGPGAGLAMAAYTVGDAIGSEVYEKGVRTDPFLDHAIGGQVNSLVRRAGSAVGQEWGVPEVAGPGGGVVLSPEARARAGDPQPLGRLPGSASTTPSFRPGEAGGGRGFVNPPTVQQSTSLRDTLNGVPSTLPGSMTEGDIYKTRDPKTGAVTYSGKNVGPNARMVNEDGTQLKQGGTVSTVPGMPRADIEAALARKAAGEAAQPMQTGVAVIGARGSRMEDDLRAKTDAPERDALLGWRMKAGGLSHQDKRQMIALDNQNAADAANRDVTRRGQDITERGNIGARDSSRLQAEVAMRGQDISARGQDLTAATARQQGRMQQMQNDRQFQLDVARLGKDAAQQNFQNRQQAVKDMDARLGTLYPGADGKPDAARVASMSAGIMSAIAGSIAQLEAIPQNSPDYAEAQKRAATLREKGVASLDDAALKRMTLQLEVKERNKEGASRFNPWAGTHVQSDNPADYDVVGVDRGITQDQYRLRGGGSMPVTDLRYDEGTSNPLLPDLKTRTNRFDELKGAR